MKKIKNLFLLVIFITIISITVFTGCIVDPDELEGTKKICIDFEDLTAGTRYYVGDEFYSNGIRIKILPFENSGGWTFTGYVDVINAGEAGGSGNELWTNNANIGIDAGTNVLKLIHKFGEYGGNINAQVNSDFVNTNNFDALSFPSVIQAVTNGHGNDSGEVLLLGDIKVSPFTNLTVGDDFNYAVGGQEAAFDDICVTINEN